MTTSIILYKNPLNRILVDKINTIIFLIKCTAFRNRSNTTQRIVDLSWLNIVAYHSSAKMQCNDRINYFFYTSMLLLQVYSVFNVFLTTNKQVEMQCPNNKSRHYMVIFRILQWNDTLVPLLSVWKILASVLFLPLCLHYL